MPYVDNVKKLCITYICTGKYNLFFYDFYRTFNENFCPGHNLTFAVITDKPEICNNIKNVKVYDIQRHYKSKDVNFIKFRKWKDILICEDLLLEQDYCFFINSNLTCTNKVTLDELFKGKSQYAVYHSLFGIQSMPMYESLCKHPKSAAFFDAQNRLKYPNYMYFQAGNTGATSQQFLKMCNFIESCRQYDLFYGLDKYIPWHDETYYNKYINTILKKNSDSINILDGKKYLCSWLPEMKPYLPTCKMLLRNKDQVWKNLLAPKNI